VELTVYPAAVVGRFVLFVVENASAVHLVVQELAFIEGTVLEHEFAFAMFEAIKFVALIMVSFVVVLVAVGEVWDRHV
jgi:hypothetical protein